MLILKSIDFILKCIYPKKQITRTTDILILSSNELLVKNNQANTCCLKKTMQIR